MARRLRKRRRGFKTWIHVMASALLVLNAGSSSIKFSVFTERSNDHPLLRGAIDGLHGKPRFVARRGEAIVGEHDWPPGTRLTHALALSFLFEWGRSGALDTDRVEAVGHRVVHGGTRFTSPCLIDAEIASE